MNILVFSWRDPKHPLAGGAEQVMHEHMKGWIHSGHNVTLFSSRFVNSKADEIVDGVNIVRKGNQYYLGVQLAGFLFYLKNRKNFDLIIDQFHGVPFFTPLYVNKPRLAVIQETARQVWFLNPLSWPLNWIIGILGYLTEPLIFLFYKNTPFMTGSKSAKDDVKEMGIPDKNITVVPHGVIVSYQKSSPKKEKIFTVTFLGVLSKDKGIEEALKCFSILKDKRKFQFWVIGKPDTESYKERVKKITSELGLEGRVTFWGFVTQEMKFKLLAKSHILINPSIKEGWGLVNIEANAFYTPVIAYKSAGLIDSVQDGLSGVLCRENSPEDLAENVLDLMDDPEKLFKLKETSFKWSKKFSWSESRSKSLQLIGKIRNEF